MQSRRDQLQAYRFLTRRALAALVAGEPDAPEPPMRRLTLTTVSGIMIAVLIAAGFGLYGLIKPGTGNKWKHDGTIVVERETGARYVYYDSELHPTLNYASAVLAAQGKDAAKVQLVARSALAGTPRSKTIGIDGLPDSMPSTSKLIRSPWTVCSQIRLQATDSNIADVTLDVGSTAGSTALGADAGVVVSTLRQSGLYLLWHGHRFAVGSTDIAAALSLTSGTPLVVGSAFLNALPQGATFATPTIPGAGQPAAQSIGGKPALIGQLLHITDKQRYAVVLGDGVHELTAVQTALLRTLPLDGQRRNPIDTTQTVELGLPQSSSWNEVSGQFARLPDTIPDLDDTPAQHGGLCALYNDGSASPMLAATSGTAPTATGTITQSDRSRRGVADSVSVEPGHAAIVQSTNGSPTVFIVADPGRKYPVASSDILASFGYGAVKPVRLPDQLLLMVSAGPAFDRTAARTPVSN